MYSCCKYYRLNISFQDFSFNNKTKTFINGILKIENTIKQYLPYLWKKIDNDIIDKFGPDGISNLIKKISNKAVKFQSGYIYQYAFIMLMGFRLILTFLIIN